MTTILYFISGLFLICSEGPML